MKIDKLVLKNYRCYKELELYFNENITVIVGNNGAGKTAILDAIAVSLGTFFNKLDGVKGLSIDKKDARLEAYQMGESFDVQPQFPVNISMTGFFDEEEITWSRSLNGKNGNTTIIDAKQMINISNDYQRRLRLGDKDVILPIIAYYGTGRLWDYHRQKKVGIFKENTKTNGYIDCLSGTANVKLMMNWFRKKTIQASKKSGDENELNIVCQAISECYSKFAGYENVEISLNLDTNDLECLYEDREGGKMKMPLSQMSDGYKSTLSLVADIAYRMAVLNPQLEEKVLKMTEGVVLIDEIDLHLHPAWQQRILEDLRTIFPKVQFIVTTHAPSVISSVKNDSLVILKDYEACSDEVENYGNDSNSIMKTVMGVSERAPEVAKLFERFYSSLKDGRFDASEKILDEIDRIRNFQDSEATMCRVKLGLERKRRQR